MCTCKEKDNVHSIVNCTNYEYNNKYTNHLIITAFSDSNHLIPLKVNSLLLVSEGSNYALHTHVAIVLLV